MIAAMRRARVSGDFAPVILSISAFRRLGALLQRAGLAVLRQHPIPVVWRGELVGDHYADLLVEGCVIVELKAVKSFDEVHMAQCPNYLKATGHRICLLINFGKPRLDVRRIILGY